MLFPADSLPPGPPIETKKALLLLDLQNDFVSLNGKLCVANVGAFLSNLTPLVAEFRAKGHVFWIGTEYKQSRSTISPVTGSHSILLRQFLTEQRPEDEASKCVDGPGFTRSPGQDCPSSSKGVDQVHDREAFLAPVISPAEYRCCTPDSPGIDYPDAIKAAMDLENDLVMLKSHYSAFTETLLLTQLRTRLITELYVCGSLSNISVYATVLDAVCHGLRVTVIEDCLGYNDRTCHVEAMRQMADNMGASGVDCQELRDDLAGLLGEVVREEDFPTKFQVSLAPPPRRTTSHTSRQNVHDWITMLEDEDAAQLIMEDERPPSRNAGEGSSRGHDSKTKSESFRSFTKLLPMEKSPPRIRSTGDLDSLEEDHPPKLSYRSSTHHSSTNSSHAEQLNQKQDRPSTLKRPPSRESSLGPLTPTTSTIGMHPRSVENFVIHKEVPSESGRAQVTTSAVQTNRETQTVARKKKKKFTPNILGPTDEIGEGDSRLCVNVLGQVEAQDAFSSCRESIKWQKMFHRSGEVPRLVAVQGDISENGTQVPIYRHPADESPELHAFDHTVDMLRKAAEKAAGHPLNHALIQWYRHGEDNISEHSDKTLDIRRGSTIVNLSLGAQRTMTLRTKRSATRSPPDNDDSDALRRSQRIPLPHNSLFILGQETNQRWLHAIRADRRPLAEKDPAELAFEGERISFTFRQIETFIDPIDNTIWGQGATSKENPDACKLLSGVEAETQGEKMIRAFGQENHRSSDWDWDEWYGTGFDVVNFETKKV